MEREAFNTYSWVGKIHFCHEVKNVAARDRKNLWIMTLFLNPDIEGHRSERVELWHTTGNSTVLIMVMCN